MSDSLAPEWLEKRTKSQKIIVCYRKKAFRHCHLGLIDVVQNQYQSGTHSTLVNKDLFFEILFETHLIPHPGIGEISRINEWMDEWMNKINQSMSS